MGGGASGAIRDLEQTVSQSDDAFGNRIADTTINKLDIPAIYPPNTERHRLVVNGVEDRTFTSPNFADVPGRYQLTGSDGDVVEFSTREQLRYVPNYELLFGLATWYDTAADQLTEGQRLYAELSDNERDNVYGYEFTPGNTRCRMVSGGDLVAELPESEWGNRDAQHEVGNRRAGNPFDHIPRDQPMNPRGSVVWYGVGPFMPRISYTREDGYQRNELLGSLSNTDDIATEAINLKPKVVLEADPGAPEFTVNVGSIGALIKGSAQEFNRPRSALLYDLGGEIGPTYAGNAPVLAKRHAPDKQNVSVKVDVPEFSPEGTVTVDIIVVAVDADATDATDWAYSRQGDPQNTAVQYTTNVSTFPTETRAVPEGGTAEVPDARLMAGSVAEGAKNDPTKAEAGPGEENKRVLGENEVALYIPRTNGATGVSLNWLRPLNQQDW